jgi:hypothetical protein
MLTALTFATQCLTACVAADCAGAARQHSHCGKHRQPTPEMPAHAICAYLPSGQAAQATARVAHAYALMPVATRIRVAVVRFDATSIDTGPPLAAAPSSIFILRI